MAITWSWLLYFKNHPNVADHSLSQPHFKGLIKGLCAPKSITFLAWNRLDTMIKSTNSLTYVFIYLTFQKNLPTLQSLLQLDLGTFTCKEIVISVINQLLSVTDLGSLRQQSQVVIIVIRWNTDIGHHKSAIHQIGNPPDMAGREIQQLNRNLHQGQPERITKES